MNPMGGLVGGQEEKKMKLPLFTRSSNPTRSQAKRGGGIEQLRVGERSKNANNSKNHQWPPPTRVGINAPRSQKREKNVKKEKINENLETLLHKISQNNDLTSSHDNLME